MEINPSDCLYHKDHLWVKREGQAEAWIGITDHAQENLGEVIYIECAAVDEEIKQGASFGNIESAKVASELISPITGIVVAMNQNATDEPSYVNRDPYRDGWIVKVRITDVSELNELMAARQYEHYVKGN